MDMLQIVLTITIFLLLVIPVGKYLYKVATGEEMRFDKFFNYIDNFVYKLSGIDEEEMNWKQYAMSLITANIVMAVIAYIILRIQSIALLNPNHVGSMEQALSFNTVISFMTNTNLQNYSGESGVSYLSQMAVMTFFMFTSAASGLAAAFAFMRGIIGRKKTVGNYFVDLVRIITRVLIPFSVVVTILLVWQGVPQTFKPNMTVTTVEGKLQDIALGPVASLESIKHIGTNGGGFFNANSAHPFENPTPLSNLIEILSMMIIPGAVVYTFGLMLKNKKQAWMIFISMSVLFLITLSIGYSAERAGNPMILKVGLSQTMGNMEGKEVRFGIAESSLFTSVTTAFTTGSVNNMHDSLMPLGGLAAMLNMMLNVVFGGKGVGFMNMMMYAVLTVFLCGLMVGRTPEFLGKKIEGKEMKLIALAIIIHPFLILMSSALALVTPKATAAVSNPGFHGLSQIVYEYTTSAANNGSAFAGLAANNMFWNTTTAAVMFFGRYLSMIILLAVAGSFAAKVAVPKTSGTFRTDNSMFAITLVFVVLIIGALTFFPALALGPIAEHLTLH